MKSVRIIRVVLLVALAAYLWLFHTANRQQVELPILNKLLPPLPVAYVVGFALLAGWAVGFIPARISAWRRWREVNKLQARLADLEAAPPREAPAPAGPFARSRYVTPEPELPVIPDRGSPYQTGVEPPDDNEAG